MKKIIFTDLDGTLLDENYTHEKAREALNLIKKKKVPLIICSSKTRKEIENHREKLENKHPFISENGGAIFIPKKYFSFDFKHKEKENYKIIELGKPYKELKKFMGKLNKKYNITSFYEMSDKKLAKETKLSKWQIKRAKSREYDIFFKINNKKQKNKILKEIKKKGLKFTEGGKYCHLMGNNDKGKAVKKLIQLYKKEYKNIKSIGLGDAKNDLPMLKQVDKEFIIEGPKDWNRIILKEFEKGRRKGKLKKSEIKEAEKLYEKSLDILEELQLKNGAILASSPGGRYPYVYPRDHAICILALIDAGKQENAKKALEFMFKSQSKNGSFPQRVDKKGKDASYKPIQLDNTGLILFGFARYIQKFNDKKFLEKNKKKVDKAVNYVKSQLNKENYLFFTPNSIHEFPPLEEGLEVWVNAICLAALKELRELKVKTYLDLDKLKKEIENHFWNGKYFIKNIRIKEASSVEDNVDASAYALADFGNFQDRNKKVKKTVSKIEKTLWNKDLGGICRYEKHIGRNNGGWGPWPHFTLMIARHYIRNDNRRKADKYLRWVLDISHKHELPEHVATKEEFEEWVEESKKAEILRKDRKVMINNIRKKSLFRNKGLAYSVLPLAWPHAEFVRTWLLYKEKFF